MRTTLDISDDVLLAAKEVARREKTSIGQALSAIARKALLAPPAGPPGAVSATADRLARLGIHVLPGGPGVPVTDELVNRLREEEGI